MMNGSLLPWGSGTASSFHIIQTAGIATHAPSRIVMTTEEWNPCDGSVKSTSGPTMNCANETENATE